MSNILKFLIPAVFFGLIALLVAGLVYDLKVSALTAWGRELGLCETYAHMFLGMGLPSFLALLIGGCLGRLTLNKVIARVEATVIGAIIAVSSGILSILLLESDFLDRLFNETVYHSSDILYHSSDILCHFDDRTLGITWLYLFFGLPVYGLIGGLAGLLLREISQFVINKGHQNRVTNF